MKKCKGSGLKTKVTIFDSNRFDYNKACDRIYYDIKALDFYNDGFHIFW